MESNSQLYGVLNKAWKSTCRIVLGDEIGELKDFEPWLREYLVLPRNERSEVSGKDIRLTRDSYCKGAKFMSFDEVDFSKKFEPLSINKIKDIDSIVEALQERFVYTGNIILGNSHFVEGSSNVVDSQFVYDSNIVSDSKYIGISSEARYSECCFGCYVIVESAYSLKTSGGKQTRCFECHFCQRSTDSYYSVQSQGCSNCMFTFGMRNGTYCIGNLQVPRDKYLELKKKIIGEVSGILKKEKRVFSVLDLVGGAQRRNPKPSLRIAPPQQARFDIGPIEDAFESTSSIVLGKKLSGVDSYAAYLQRNSLPNVFVKSALTGRKIAIGGHIAHLVGLFGMGNRTIDGEEIVEIGKMKIDEKRLNDLRAEPEVLTEILAPIAYAGLDTVDGNNQNIGSSTIMIDSSDCYNGSSFIKDKKCAFCHWPRESECVFGSSALFKSSFCINCFHSKNITRAFELDNCNNCSDAYFMHNCENVHDSMFCFNVKNLRNAIGNAAMPLDKYKSAKKSILEQIVSEIEKKKTLKWDIYNIGCAK